MKSVHFKPGIVVIPILADGKPVDELVLTRGEYCRNLRACRTQGITFNQHVIDIIRKAVQYHKEARAQL